jgi:hypothetical protein
MTKETLLRELIKALRAGTVTRHEVESAMDDAEESRGREASLILPHRSLNMAEVLSAVGGTIVFLGICILVGQNWDILNPPARVLTTLGGALVAYVTGTLFSMQPGPRMRLAAQAFFLVVGLTLPIGIAVTFHEAGFMVGTSGMQTTTALLLTAFHVCSYLALRKQVFAFFAVAAGVWLVYAFTAWMLRGAAGLDIAKIMEYLTLGVGASGILLGYGWRSGELRGMTPLMYAAGLIGFLGAALALGGYAPNQNVFWEVLFPALALWAVFLSSHLRSSVFLAIGSLYLMADILKTTAEYFSDSLGWPFALVIAGLGLIGVGAFTWRMNHRAA